MFVIVVGTSPFSGGCVFGVSRPASYITCPVPSVSKSNLDENRNKEKE